MTPTPIPELSSIVLQANVVEIAQSVNAVWVLLASFLVFFMQPGFALLEAGQVRAKNVANVTMKNLMDWSLGLVSYFLLGLGIAVLVGQVTSPGGVSLSSAFSYVNDPTAWIGWLFGAVFTMTAATIVSGAVAGRIAFRTYVLFAVLMTTLIYPTVQGLVWQGGLLSADGFLGMALGAGYMDFAGATVVHMTGGVAGLVAAWSLGPRKDRFVDGESTPIPGHSVFLAMLGTFVLAFGWYGFNVGTQATVLTTDGTFNGAALGRVALNTTLGMAGGTLAAALVTTAVRGDPDPLFSANGMLAGLVAVTGAAAHVTWWGGLALGVLGGALVMPAHNVIANRFHVDDVCGVFSVHGVSGAVGTILIPLFAVGPDGAWQVMGLAQIAMQVVGVAVIALWTVGTTLVAFHLIESVLGYRLRVTDDDEDAGLDVSEHSIMAYPDFTIADGGTATDESETSYGAAEPTAPVSPDETLSGDAEASTATRADEDASGAVMWRGVSVQTGDRETAVGVGSVVETITRPALVVDETGTVKAINERALERFELDRGQIVDSPLGFDPRLDAVVGDVVDSAVGNRRAVVDRVVTHDAETFSVSADRLVTGLHDDHLVTVTDVTEETDRRARQSATAAYRDLLLSDHESKLQRLAAGSLDVDQGVEEPGEQFDGSEEVYERFRALDQAVTTIARDVRSIVEQLPNQSAELAAQSETLSNASQDVMEAAEETDDLSTEIEADVRELSEQAADVSRYVEEQSAAMEEISASAAKIREQSSDATELTEQAVSEVRSSVDHIRASTDASNELVTEIDALEAQMTDVSEIVGIIQGIADQTNILALNASIEAARAEQDGDGFAVVADEVKALAEDARGQATQISEIVDSVESQTQDLTTQIRSSNADVVDNTEALTAVVESLEQAQERVEDTNHGIREITRAVEEQAENATAMTTKMEAVNDLAEQINEKVRDISANSNEQADTLSNVAVMADELSDLAADVDGSVDAFDTRAVVSADD